MAFHQGRYYVRKRREGRTVRSEYVGAGLVGEIAARADQEARTERDRRQDQDRQALAQLRESESPMDVLLNAIDQAAKVAVCDALTAAGYHRHKGEWRKKRDASV